MEFQFFPEIVDKKKEFLNILSKDLALKIINQAKQHQPNDNPGKIQNTSKQTNMQNSLMVNSLNVIKSNLTKPQLRLNSLKQEQGAPNWLTTLPMKEEKYNLTTGHY